MVENELLKKMIKSKIKTNNAIENGNRLIDYNEAKDEIDRKLELLDEIIFEYKTDNYQKAANLIWKEILRDYEKDEDIKCQKNY